MLPLFFRKSSTIPALGPFLRFLTSGGSATAIHWLVMALLIRLDTSALAASVIGSVSGAVVNFFLQSAWTFRKRVGARSALRYLGVCFFSWLTNAILLYGLLHLAGVPTVVAQAFTSAVVALLNFILFKEYVFHDTREK